MAVTESKGNGYSLFNGVKLPSLPEYDKEKYPYVHVSKRPDSAARRFVAATHPFYVNEDGRVVASVDLNLLTCTYIPETSEQWGSISTSDKTEGSTLPAAFSNPTYSNYDILNTTDNSVYLAASEPISLDGMNVIEWDGDTEGLELFPGSTDRFHVSNTTDFDVNLPAIAVTYTQSAQDAFQFVTANNLSFKQLANGSYSCGGFVRGVKQVEDIADGVYLRNTLTGKEQGSYISLFAYYPIENEKKMSDGEAMLIHKMFPKLVAYAITGKWFV